jgi:hypothetical protein
LTIQGANLRGEEVGGVAEDGDDVVASVDADVGDERLDEPFAFLVAAGGEDVAELGGAGVQFVGRGCLFDGCLEQVGEFCSSVAELGDRRPKGADSFAALVLRQRAVLEGGEVAVDGAFGFGEVGVEGGEFGFPLCVQFLCRVEVLVMAWVNSLEPS